MSPFRRTRQSGSRQGNLKQRLLIAAALVLFSLVSYYSMGATNPVTGEVQRVAMSTEQEIAMGLRARPEMAAQHGGLHPDPEAQARVDRVGARLLAALEKRLADEGRQNPYHFEFHLLRDDRTINAFALPGH